MDDETVNAGSTVDATETGSQSSGGASGSRTTQAGGQRYARGAEIGRGGVGKVRNGVDQRLGRSVAIKELLAPSPAARARFRREARITARLEHPGIVPLYDQDWGDDGEPFYVMRRVAGRSLASELAARSTEAERLALIPTMLAVADTIGYAHSRGVIHRDLKPANVLCGDHGTVLVIDWGLAKDLRVEPTEGADADREGADHRVARDPELTSVGTVVGTPAYMAPEQARGEAVDERADVYALGAMLYDLLTGAAPHPARGADGVAAAATSAPLPIRDRAPHAPRDLVAVVERAMAREVRARYANAAELARDLRAFLSGGLVSTYRYSPRERLSRWVSAHRTALIITVVLGAALVVTGSVSIVRIAAERDRARGALALVDVRDRERAVAHAAAELERDPTAAVAWLKQGATNAADAPRIRSLAESAIARGVARHVFPLDGVGALVATDVGAIVATDDRGTVWTWAGDRQRRVASGRGGARAFAVRDGWALWGDRDGVAWRTRIDTGATTALGRSSWVRDGAIAADGAMWWVDVDGVVRRVAGDDLEEIARTGGPTADLEVEGDRWAVGLENGTVVTGARGGPARRANHHEREITAMRFLGETLVTVAEDGRVMAWDLASDAKRELGRHDDWVSAIAVSPDGRRVATGSGDGSIRIWSLDGQPATVLTGHRSHIAGLAWSALGLASAERDGVIRLWGETPDTFSSFHAGGRVRRLVWRGEELVGLVEDTLRVWSALPAPVRHLRAELTSQSVLAADPDGRYLAAGGKDGRFAVWTLADGRLVLSQLVAGPIVGLRVASGGRLVVATPQDAELWALDGAEPRRVTTLRTGGGTSDPTPFRDGVRVAWVDSRGAALIVSADGPARSIAVDANPVALAITPDQDAILVASKAGVVSWWPLDGRAPRQVGSAAAQLSNVRTSPSARWVVSAPRGAATLVWPFAGGAARALADTEGATSAPVLTRDDQLAVGVGHDLVVLPLDGTRPTLRLRGHRANVTATTASIDGSLLASCDEDGEVRLWHRGSGATVVLGTWGPGVLVRALGGDKLAIATRDEVLVYSAVSRLTPLAAGPLPDVLVGVTRVVIDASLAPRSPTSP